MVMSAYLIIGTYRCLGVLVVVVEGNPGSIIPPEHGARRGFVGTYGCCVVLCAVEIEPFVSP